MLLAATLTERKTTNVGLYSNNEVLMIENDYSLPYEKLPAELAEHPHSPIRSPWRRAEGMFPMDPGERAEARFRRSRRTAAPLRTVDSENQANNHVLVEKHELLSLCNHCGGIVVVITEGEACYDTWCLDPRRMLGHATVEYTALKAIEDAVKLLLRELVGIVAGQRVGRDESLDDIAVDAALAADLNGIPRQRFGLLARSVDGQKGSDRLIAFAASAKR